MNPTQFNQGAPIPAAQSLPPRTSTLAIWSLVLGLVSLPAIFVCLGFISAPVAIILGIIALTKIKGAPNLKGKGMALTGLISGVASLVIYGCFIAWVAKNHDPSERPDESGFIAANSLIFSNNTGAAHGNSDEARELAASFSEMMGTMQASFFVREGEEAKMQLSGGEFVTFCQISQEEGVAFLVHVPEYRRYEDDAKDSLAEMAWEVSNLVLSAGGEFDLGTPIAVGLKGTVLYGEVMIGELGEDSPAKSGLAKEELVRFFVEEEPVAVESEVEAAEAE